MTENKIENQVVELYNLIVREISVVAEKQDLLPSDDEYAMYEENSNQERAEEVVTTKYRKKLQAIFKSCNQKVLDTFSKDGLEKFQYLSKKYEEARIGLSNAEFHGGHIANHKF